MFLFFKLIENIHLKMEGIINEGKMKGAIDAITLEKVEKITEQMKTCICMVYGELIGTGFFCKILYKNRYIPVLITNYHIISDEFIKNNKKIKISINNEKIFDIIKINENNKIYSSEENKYDIMIIKLDEEKNIYHYLELDEHIDAQNLENLYEDKSIYILHYPNGDKVSVSFGYGIMEIDKYYIKHLCNTEHCSSGSPILNLKTNKVIGIHSGFIFNQKEETKYNIGIFLKYPLKELNINNEIRMTIKIDESDINEKIYFIDNSDYTEYKNKVYHFHDYLKELNDSNTELYINDIKYKYKKYFRPKQEGLYLVKLKFNIDIKDCSHMFHFCLNTINIDFYSFNPENITNMSYMFYGCISLETLPDISKWDTRNVSDMSYMFHNCESLKSLPDISNWNTSKVTNMSYMFYNCKSLKSLPDISKWNIRNVIDMSYMFHCCLSLKSLPDISKWNIEKVINMNKMFYNCSSLYSLPNISKWKFNKNVTKYYMFDGCNEKIIPSIFK